MVAHDPVTGREIWSVKNGDPGRGDTNTATVWAMKDTLIVGIRGRRVRHALPPHRLRTGDGAPALARLLDGP